MLEEKRKNKERTDSAKLTERKVEPQAGNGAMGAMNLDTWSETAQTRTKKKGPRYVLINLSTRGAIYWTRRTHSLSNQGYCAGKGLSRPYYVRQYQSGRRKQVRLRVSR